MLMINLKKNKTLYFFLILFVILIIISVINPQGLRNAIMKIVPTEMRLKFKTVVFGKEYLEKKRYYYDINYNEKKLPQIQFEKLETIKLDVNSLINKPMLIKNTPIIKNGEIVPGNLMKVTLSCDHRIVDGAMGSAFLQTLKELIEDPIKILV